MAKSELSQAEREALLKKQIDNLQQQLAAVETEREVLTFLLNSIPEFASYINADLTYRVCNRKYEIEADISCQEILGKHVTEFIGNEAFDKIQPYLLRVLSGESVAYKDRIDYKYLKEQDVEVQYTPHRSTDGEILGFATYVHNITKQLHAEEALRRQALHCPLTGLPNRLLLKECLESGIAGASRRQGRLGLLFIDLDEFKLVNDALGHDVGDQVLRDIAENLAQVIRSNDTLARFGGDEFVLLVDDIQSLEQLISLAEKIVALVSNLQISAPQEIKIGASIGIACFPDHCTNGQELLILADQAMYKAKKMGKSGYFLYEKNRG
ncbi:MAG: GGDEF domain-containing protein [Thermodesulfobacteriota bacterium]